MGDFQLKVAALKLKNSYIYGFVLYNMITILFLSANPANTQPLELINECNKIEEELRFAAGPDKFDFRQRHDIALEDLRKQILVHKPQIIHFSGHGSEESELIFKGKNGEVQTVPQGALSEFFEILGKDISLVFLNACYSEEQANAISKHVNFVIGMSRAISDKAAIKFAVSFYSSFGFGKSVEDSFKLAKVDLKFESIPEEATPRLLVKEQMNASNQTISTNDPLSSSNLYSKLDQHFADLRLNFDSSVEQEDFQPLMDAIDSIFHELENNRKLIGSKSFEILETSKIACRQRLNSLERARSSGIENEIYMKQTNFISAAKQFIKNVEEVIASIKTNA